MQKVREKLKRKLSMHDKNPNLDDDYDEQDIDDETVGNIGRDADKAEAGGYDQGKPGSFLNKMILHGNKKTEDQIARETAEAEERRRIGQDVGATGGGVAGGRPLDAGARAQDQGVQDLSGGQGVNSPEIQR